MIIAIQACFQLTTPTEAVTPAPDQSDWTWRYIGARDEADFAYCRRFDISPAPEPLHAYGAWCYPLPEKKA